MAETPIKVLIIDDNKTLLEVTSDALQLEGFVTDTAEDGATGYGKIVSGRPDVVLLDVKLPDTDGFEICRQVRGNPATAAIPIILMTGDMAVDIDKGFSVGADDCIIKPIDLGYVTGMISKLAGKRIRALVVDDDRQVSEMLKGFLEKHQFEVDTFHDGTAAMEAINSGARYQVILLDISLQVPPDGVELCRRIKNLPATKAVPVIMMTANEYTDSVEKCFEYGAEDYVFKPFNMSDLLLRIKKYLKKKP